ncbi:DUF6600 domain-containing protein, partial [Acidobacteriota bacterium]
MKHTIFVLCLLILIVSISCIIYVPADWGDDRPRRDDEYYEDTYDEYDLDLDNEYFYRELNPHGFWVYMSPHGYVWIPEIDRNNWRPYSNGRWFWTDYGWTWVSVYDWGRIPFHYGRWGWDSRLGWFWVPGHTWGPSWVTWRTGGSYIGWAALPPDARYIAGGGIWNLEKSLPHRYWIFCDSPYFLNSRLDRYILPYERNRTIINHTVVKTQIAPRSGRIVNNGLEPSYVERLNNQRISKYQIQDAQRAERTRVDADRVVIHKPTIKRNDSAKPRIVVERREAEDRVSKTRIKKTENLSEEDVFDRHRQEEELIKRSQEKQMSELQIQMEKKSRGARTSVEKKKVEQEYDQKAKTLKKQHEDEKKVL